eukprot:6172585-Pleurochrysis_carterae.AAC.7
MARCASACAWERLEELPVTFRLKFSCRCTANGVKRRASMANSIASGMSRATRVENKRPLPEDFEHWPSEVKLMRHNSSIVRMYGSKLVDSPSASVLHELHEASDALEERRLPPAATLLAPCAAVSAGQRRRTPWQRRTVACRYGLKLLEYFGLPFASTDQGCTLLNMTVNTLITAHVDNIKKQAQSSEAARMRRSLYNREMCATVASASLRTTLDERPKRRALHQMDHFVSLFLLEKDGTHNSSYKSCNCLVPSIAPLSLFSKRQRSHARVERKELGALRCGFVPRLGRSRDNHLEATLDTTCLGR